MDSKRIKCKIIIFIPDAINTSAENDFFNDGGRFVNKKNRPIVKVGQQHVNNYKNGPPTLTFNKLLGFENLQLIQIKAFV